MMRERKKESLVFGKAESEKKRNKQRPKEWEHLRKHPPRKYYTPISLTRKTRMQSRQQCSTWFVWIMRTYVLFFSIHFIWHWMSILSYEYKIFPFRYLHCYGLQSSIYITLGVLYTFYLALNQTQRKAKDERVRVRTKNVSHQWKEKYFTKLQW